MFARFTFVLLGLVLLVGAARGQTASNSATLRIEAPHAGLAVCLPEDFQVVPLTSPQEIIRAVKAQDQTAVNSVSILTERVDPQMTTESYFENITNQLRRNLAIRHLEVQKSTPIPVANLPGLAWRLEYSFRGKRTSAVSACFIREATTRSPRMCYLINVESLTSESSQLVKVFGHLVKNISLIPMQHPADISLDTRGPTLEDTKLGYSFRPPLGWFAQRTPTGVLCMQMDYLRGGLDVPRLQIIIRPETERTTSKTVSKEWVDKATESATQNGLLPQIYSEGPVNIAGHEWYQTVLFHEPKSAALQSATAPAGAKEEPAIIAQRSVCLPTGQGTRQSYSLVLLMVGQDNQKGVKLLEALGENFSVIRIQPANAAEPAEQK